MIETWQGKRRICCDSCPTEIVDSAPNFYDTIENIKDDGWKLRQVGKIWKHFCPACVAEGKMNDHL